MKKSRQNDLDKTNNREFIKLKKSGQKVKRKPSEKNIA